MKRTRSYLPATQLALQLLGLQIAEARRARGWTAAQLAERLGANVQLVGRIERGEPGTAVGTMFEAAVICGVGLFTPDPTELGSLVETQKLRVALLPTRVRPKVDEVDDNF